jgi:methionyl-tRNA synthetase
MNYFTHNRYFISTAITYTNAVPHIGSAFEYILTDALARHLRVNDKEVFFVTGTDDYGVKNLKKALEWYSSQNPEKDTSQLTEEETRTICTEYIRIMLEKFKEIHRLLNISYDYFISTATDPNHTEAVHKIWNKIEESDDLYGKEYSGYYCEGCESFKTQKDLIDGKCPEHPNRDPEYITVNDIFFRVSKYADRIKEATEADRLLVKPEYQKSKIVQFLSEDVDDTSVTRDKSRLKWGIQVPEDENRVMYVWIDALTNYITASGYGTDEELFRKRWIDSYKIHIIGKGIERFHLSIWPAMLMSADIPLQNETFVHGFINIDGQKISKSLGNVINPGEVIERYSTDALRYWALTRGKLSEDIDFTWEKFGDVYSSDLVNGLGNTLNRVLAIRKNPGKDSEKYQPTNQGITDILDSIEKELSELPQTAELSFYEYNLKPLKDRLFVIIDRINELFNSFKPWEFSEDERESLACTLGNYIATVFEYLYPITPETSEVALKKMLERNIIKGSHSSYSKISPYFSGVDQNAQKFLFRKIN